MGKRDVVGEGVFDGKICGRLGSRFGKIVRELVGRERGKKKQRGRHRRGDHFIYGIEVV